MLISSRRCGESFMIGESIEIKVTEMTGDRVKIGIDAPQDYKIMRKELCQTVESNREAAAGAVPKDWLNLLAGLEPAAQDDTQDPAQDAPREPDAQDD